MQEKINSLMLKKARLLSEIEMLSEVSPLMYQNLGKVTAELHLLMKQQLRETENLLDD